MIANLTSEMLEYFWINHNGKSDWRIGAIPPRDSVRLASPLGYRFRVVNRSGRTIALEIKITMGVVNIEDTPDGLVLRWEQDALADIDFESSKTQATKPEYQAFIRKHNIWRCEIPVDDALFLKPYNMRYVGWSKRGQRYRFIFNEFNERGHGHVRLLEIGLDGVVNLLVEEKSATVVDYD